MASVSEKEIHSRKKYSMKLVLRKIFFVELLDKLIKHPKKFWKQSSSKNSQAADDIKENEICNVNNADDNEDGIEKSGESEDDLDQIFPNIYYWYSKLSQVNDILNIIFPMAIEKYNSSVLRARGPRGSLADMLRRGMFNGRDVSNICSSIVFFPHPESESSYLHRRVGELVVFDCILKDRNFIRPPQLPLQRWVILNQTLRHDIVCEFDSLFSPLYIAEQRKFLVVGVGDKVVLWTGFNLDSPFTFIMKADYTIRWRFSSCNNDLILARQILQVPEQKHQVAFLDKTVVGHRLVVAIGVNKGLVPDSHYPYSGSRNHKTHRGWVTSTEVFHMVLDVSTATWSFLQQQYHGNWEVGNICFEWNRRLYVWNILSNWIRYFDFDIGKWVQKGNHLKTLTNAFAQLRQILRHDEKSLRSETLPIYKPLLIVASRSGTLFCIDKFCLPKCAGDKLVYAMNNINRGWVSVYIFQDPNLDSVFQNPHRYNSSLKQNPSIYEVGLRPSWFGEIATPKCWPIGEDSILLLLFHRDVSYEHAEDWRYRYSWYMINERDGIKEFNGIQLPVPNDSFKINIDYDFQPVFLQNDLGMM